MNRSVKFASLVFILIIGLSNTLQPSLERYNEISKNIEIFTNIYKEVNTHYVDDLDPGKFMRTGIDAMMESLDPYTNYISESDIEGYRLMTEGRYNGIGAVSRKIGDFVTITQLYKDQPADKAGLRAGDKIVAVDGKNVVGKRSDDVNDFLRGAAQTDVVLTVRRPGKEKDFDVTLTRAVVDVPNVPYFGLIEGDIAYVALTTFTMNAGKNVGDGLKKLKKENPNLKGVIFDLRNNGGGLLREAVNICNLFIPKGEIVVTTKGKVKDRDLSFRTNNNPFDIDLPLTVLINKNSASASEIVCGAMQDYDRGVLLGQRSYGKGLVQKTRDVGYNAKVKLTTAKYYIPSKRCIQSVEYRDGEPVNIPDEERTVFETRNKRKVLDGGGVQPDIQLDRKEDASIIQSLIRQNMIFDYVTNFCMGKDSISDIDNFEFTQFDDFVAFVESKNFDYSSSSEKLLQRLEKIAKEDGYELEADIEALKSKVEMTKKGEIKDFKEVITDLIEKDIASRYFYQEGRIKMGLKNDEEVKEAIKVLRDQSRYNEILAIK